MANGCGRASRTLGVAELAGLQRRHRLGKLARLIEAGSVDT